MSAPPIAGCFVAVFVRDVGGGGPGMVGDSGFGGGTKMIGGSDDGGGGPRMVGGGRFVSGQSVGYYGGRF